MDNRSRGHYVTFSIDASGRVRVGTCAYSSSVVMAMAARGNGSSLGVDLALILILLVFALATIFWNPLVWKSLYKGLEGHPMPEKSAAASALRWYTWISLIVLVVFAVFVLAKMM